MVRQKLLLIRFRRAVGACSPLRVSPVAAQFGTIFGGPPRPPADIPSARPVGDDRYYSARPQQPIWPREPQVVQPPPGGYPPPPQGYPQQGYPRPGYPPQQAGRPPAGVQQQDLPPPPGAGQPPPRFRACRPDSASRAARPARRRRRPRRRTTRS